ncbi:MAG: hypothetical protein WKF91_19415 [Segetibacter sp.]
MVLQGESYINKFDKKKGAQILAAGKEIYNTLSVKRQAYTGKTANVGGKAVPLANMKYDAKYVKENPAIDAK